MYSKLLLLAFLLFPAHSDRSMNIHFHSDGFRTHLTHVDSDSINSVSNFTKLQLLQRSLGRSERRRIRLTSHVYIAENGVKKPIGGAAAVHGGEGEFLISLSIGNPSVPFNAIIDTGSDLIWSQCQPCENCFNQTTPIYDPSTSVTFSKIPCSASFCRALPYSVGVCNESEECDYLYTYGDDSITKGYLATETLSSFKSSLAANVVFGCGISNGGVGFNQSTGVLGLGRGDLSFNSQMNYTKYSYCLTDYVGSKWSPIFFGSASPSIDDFLLTQTTPFDLKNSEEHPSYYYLNLLTISVGETKVRLPARDNPNPNSGDGFIIDSGTSITFLAGDTYRGVKYALLSQVHKHPLAPYMSELGLDLCFTIPKTATYSQLRSDFPKMVFNLEGADWVIPLENYMIKHDEDGAFCLAMAPSSGISIFGNFLQKNFLIQFDLNREALSFAPVHCDRLSYCHPRE